MLEVSASFFNKLEKKNEIVLVVGVGPRPIFEEYLVIVNCLVLRLPVEYGAHVEAKIMGSRHLLWNLFGFFGNIVMGKGCWPLFRTFSMYK
jgi:hypothetical protein